MGELKHEEGMRDAITELKSLMHGHHIENNSADNSKISGSMSGRVVETSLYGKGTKSPADSEIEKAKKALIDFSIQVKNGETWEEKKYKEEIIGKWRN